MLCARSIYLKYALKFLQLPNGESLHERKLRDSLEAEREAVLDFMYTTVDSVSVAFLESFPQLNWQGRSCKTVNQLDGHI